MIKNKDGFLIKLSNLIKIDFVEDPDVDVNLIAKLIFNTMLYGNI